MFLPFISRLVPRHQTKTKRAGTLRHNRLLLLEPLEQRALLATLPLALPGSVDGSLVQNDDYQVYSVNVTAGESLIFRLDGTGNDFSENELYVRYGSEPTRATHDFAANEADLVDQHVTVPTTQAGTYYVMVYASSVFSNDDYTLRVDSSSSLPGLTIAGNSASGIVKDAGGYHLYRVDNVTAGQNLIVHVDTLSSMSNVTQSELYVRRGLPPTSTQHDFAATDPDPDQYVTIPSTQAGTYYIAFNAPKSYSNTEYTLRVDTPNSFPHFATFPGQVGGTLTQIGDHQMYRLDNVPAGQHLVFQLETDDSSENELYVRHADMPTLEVYDYAAEFTNPDQYLEVPVSQAGTYYVMVNTSQTLQPVDYSLSVNSIGSVPTLAFPGQVTATFTEDGDYHLYRVENVPAGINLDFQLDATNAFSANKLYVRHGALPTQDDYDYAATQMTSDQQLAVPSAQAGTYYVMVHATSVLTGGDYTLSLAGLGTMSANIHAVLQPSGASLGGDQNGESATLPNQSTWLDEWSSCFVDIWAETTGSTNVGVSGFSVELNYETGYFTVADTSNIQPGPAFGTLTSSIDDVTGKILLGGTTTLTNVGDDQYVLLGRVLFEPRGGAGVDHNATGGYITPTTTDFTLTAPLVNGVGIGSMATTVGQEPDTGLWPVMYDIGDSGDVNFGDLAFFANAFQQNVGDAGATYAWAADFDHSGNVNFGDLAFFAANFRRSAGDGAGPLTYAGGFPSLWPLMAETSLPPSAEAASLTHEQLASITTAAIARTAGSQDDLAANTLNSIHFEIVDLPGNMLGQVVGGSLVQIDVNAAGYGWFVDPSPGSDTEFTLDSTFQRTARPGDQAAGRIDLLTTVMHELGHALGHGHSDETTLMSATLPLGTRRLADDAFEQLDDGFDFSEKNTDSLDTEVLDQLFANL